jgi:hypothetical protein
MIGKKDGLPRRNVGISEETWRMLGHISVETGKSKSVIVEEILSRCLPDEEELLQPGETDSKAKAG